MVGIPDLVNFLRDPAVATVIAVLTVFAGTLAWLYGKFRKPRLEVSLEPVTSYPDRESALSILPLLHHPPDRL